MHRRKNKGFTLIELIIVVAIISILAAIAIPAYQDHLIRSQVSEGITVAGTARAAVWEYASNYGNLPASNPDAGLPLPTDMSGKYVSQVEVGSGGIQITFGREANAAINGATLMIRPSLAVDASSVNWVCSDGTLASEYRPTNCR